MKQMKKILSATLAALLAVLCLAGCASGAGGPKTAGKLTDGDYILFGSYQGQPILWQVIGRDDFGNPLLYSDKILTYKAFDNVFWLANTDRNNGNNYWLSSDLRTWLNSPAEYVKYDKDGAPTSGSVLHGYNSYAGEAGFLSGFTQAEQKAVFIARNRQIIDEANQNADAVENPGASMHQYDSSADSCTTNYAEARYLYTNDKVFLLDVAEFHSLVYSKGLAVEKQPTEQAAAAAQHPREGGFESYWLRTPRCSYADPEADPKYNGISAKPDGASVRTVFGPNLVLAQDAMDGSVGVVPALYLKHSTVLTGGTGDAGSPYTTDGSQYGLEQFTHDKALLTTDTWKPQLKSSGISTDITWSLVSGEGIATVAADGTITAVAPGVALVQATSTQDGSCSDIVRVTVYENLPQHVPAVLDTDAVVLDAAGGNIVTPVITVTAGENASITGLTLSAAGTVFELRDIKIAEDGKTATFTLALQEGKKLQDVEPYQAAVDVAQSGRFLGEKVGRELNDPVDTLPFTLTVSNLEAGTEG